ncbi:MAG: hypothetical protein AB4040_12625 [Synechococcus sp.]
MTPSTIRQFWRTIDGLDWSGLPRQNDDELLPILLAACNQHPVFSQIERQALVSYISRRMPLIREIATCG